MTFDENNMFSCEPNNDENKPLLLSFYRDDEAMSLRVSVLSQGSVKWCGFLTDLDNPPYPSC